MAGRGAKRLPSASSLFLIHSVKVTRPGSPSGRPAHSRPGHAQWLLCRLVFAYPVARGPERCARQGGSGPAQAPLKRHRPDGQFSWHPAERMGRRPGLSSFDTYLAPFIRKDNLDYATVRQCIQEFVYNLNVPSRWGTQTPFTNITFDWVCPDDLRELLKRGNGLFGSAEQTGSLGVVTVNCARLGYLYKGDKLALYARLSELMDPARDSLETKRQEIGRLMVEGLFPYTKRYLGTLRNHFSTIGVNGLNEMVRNFTDDQEDISTEQGRAFALELLDHVRERMKQYQEETGHLYNLEATPAEGTTYRFAKEDQKRFADILQAGTPDAPYYTNSSQLPVGYTDDPFEALDLQDELQTRYTGGTVLHLYMRERISDATTCARFVRRVLENYRLPYITVTPTFSICPVHGYLNGEHEFCPKCDELLMAGQPLPASAIA